MTEKELNEEYFEWMCQLVNDERYTHGLSYLRLLSYIHNTNFEYSLPMDGNRSEDGMDLRYRFGYEKNYKSPIIADLLDIHPCSILEMMVALALRCEEHIMSDDDIGNRTGQWFWTMIDSLGLSSMDDSHFDKTYTDDVIFRFLRRQYKPNGEGGLFTINDCDQDMRNAEIWWQMNWYLDYIM